MDGRDLTISPDSKTLGLEKTLTSERSRVHVSRSTKAGPDPGAFVTKQSKSRAVCREQNSASKYNHREKK